MPNSKTSPRPTKRNWLFVAGHFFVIRISTFVILFALFGASLRAEDQSASSAVVAARGLIQRIVPEEANQFTVETIQTTNGQDVFEVASRDGKIVLRGNDGVSIASALNWYLENECHCDISWNCGNQLDLSKPLPTMSKTVRVVSPHKYRYAYNFCTHGYTMAWWHWPQWQREIDFLALNGVNLALVIEGQEATWINTLTNLGYSASAVRNWVVDPAHLPWMEMDNMENYGGPMSPQLVANRLELGQKIVARMRSLGIQPVLPGYYGMVPPDFGKRFPKANVSAQGDWGKLRRPDILDPTDPMFSKVAASFYAAQNRLFGGANFYAADPFHEGGKTKGIDIPAAGRAIFNAMNGATWVLQSWQKNPRQDMIDALDKNKLLVLDLWCEAHENWRERNNFDGTPWLWCTIENFGGNTGLGGRLEWVNAEPGKAANDPAAGRMSGIGALMEGSQTVPALWELFFENTWRTNAPGLQTWLNDYARRRYGAAIPAAERAWDILASTVYDSPASSLELPINSVVCARPSLNPDQHAREWATTKSYYDTTKVLEAWKLLLDAAPRAKASDGYRYDLCDVGRQALADLGTRYHRQIIAAYHAKDTNAVRLLSHKMLGLIRDMDRLVGTRKEFLLGTWLADARSWGTTAAEKNLCERDARELLTAWTDLDNVTDYANRQWNGLLGEFYQHRWKMWLDALNDSLTKNVPLDEQLERKKICDWELWWARQHDSFPTKPHGDTIAISRELFKKYAADASKPQPNEKETSK